MSTDAIGIPATSDKTAWYELLKRDINAFNAAIGHWRVENPDAVLDLSHAEQGAVLTDPTISRFPLGKASPEDDKLIVTDLRHADLRSVNLSGHNFGTQFGMEPRSKSDRKPTYYTELGGALYDTKTVLPTNREKNSMIYAQPSGVGIDDVISAIKSNIPGATAGQIAAVKSALRDLAISQERGAK
jgi:hypothetical protein